MRWTPNPDNVGNEVFGTYSIGPREQYYRIAFSIGVQLNLKQHFSVNFEAGGNLNTARAWYYYPFERYKRLSCQAAINLVYRF